MPALGFNSGHVGNLSRHTKGTVGAQYGHVSSSSWGTVGAKSIVWAQYGKVQYGHSMGAVGAQLGHERVKCQEKFCFKSPDH